MGWGELRPPEDVCSTEAERVEGACRDIEVVPIVRLPDILMSSFVASPDSVEFGSVIYVCLLLRHIFGCCRE